VKDRLHTGLVIAVILLVGVLLGSSLLEWGDRRLETPADPSTSLSATPRSLALGRERFSVEVLNGAGAKGAAARISDQLRDMGFDVKTFGNARDFDHERSVLLDRSGRNGAAKAIADSLGGLPIQTEPAPELYLDATLILGPDWERLLTPSRR
jgi:hypothetical protein